MIESRCPTARTNRYPLLRALVHAALATVMAAWSMSCRSRSSGTSAGTPWDVTKARGQTKVVDFTTDEGTWMSVDISADGQWVVFDLLANV